MSWRMKYWLANAGVIAMMGMQLALVALFEDTLYYLYCLPANIAVSFACGRVVGAALLQREREAGRAA